MLTGVSALSLTEQRAALLGLMDDEWQRTLRYGLCVADDTPLADVVKAMETHLRAQRNVVVDRRDFYARCQQSDERFDDFLCAVREIAAFCDFCSHCVDDQIRDRIVCGVRDDEAVRRLLENKDLTLQRAIDICRACENARTACADIRGPPGSDVRRVRTAGAAGSAPRSRGQGPAGRSEQRRCQRCGRAEHGDPAWCRAADAVCRSCGLRGHFAVMCRGEADSPRRTESVDWRFRGRSRGGRTEARQPPLAVAFTVAAQVAFTVASPGPTHYRRCVRRPANAPRSES